MYDAILNWVCSEYGVDKNKVIRPFYPGRDYESEDYQNKIVVDNPPFSIFKKIVKFYVDNGVKFFLFGPGLTIGSIADLEVTMLITDTRITYHNGAVVNTSFCTNLDDPETIIRVVPQLTSIIRESNCENLRREKKITQKHLYPKFVTSTAMLGRIVNRGVEIKIPRKEMFKIRKLEHQNGKYAIFGGGFLISKRVQRLIEEAENEPCANKICEDTKEWKLSEREMEIVEKLSKNPT